MTLFRTMINTVQDEDSLQQFILQNIHHFHNLSNSGYDQLAEEKNDIRQFIESKSALLENIDYSLSQTRAFISILFDFCEIFGFIASSRIENTLNKREIYIGKRREASKLFLLGVRENSDYINRFESICKLINEAVQEEATALNAITTFANYYLKVVRDTHYDYAAKIKSLIDDRKDDFVFLQHPLISDIFEVDIQDVVSAESEIIELIESYKRNFVYPRGIGSIGLLIEEGTDYVEEIDKIDITFIKIRDIAYHRVKGLSTNLKGRGVLPLETIHEIFVYLYRYGRMHYAKMISAFEYIQFEDISNPIEIIDWGCGQGIASLALKEYMDSHGIEPEIKSVTLIELSELTLKRASLHTHKIYPSSTIRTVSKDFNSLIPHDVQTRNDTTKIHLLSNILDLNENFFSQSDLISLIEETQKGENIFICVSPYQSDDEVDRVDAFKRHFEESHPRDFTRIYEVENSGKLCDPYWNCNNNYKGNMNVFCTHINNGCDCKWTRFIRVFKVII